MTHPLVNLHQMKRHLGIPATTTADDDRLLAACRAAAAQLEYETGRRLTPYRASIPHNTLTFFPNEIALKADLIDLIDVTDAVGAVPLADITASPTVEAASLLRRTTGFFVVGVDGLSVTAVWGWHDDVATAWADAGDAPTGNILAADTSFTVTDADALMSDGLTPRFAVGQLLRLDDEFMAIEAINTGTNTLTVTRGVNGTTAADHTAGTSIRMYRPPYDVLVSALQLGAWLYRQPDQPVPGTAVPAPVVATATRLRRLTVA